VQNMAQRKKSATAGPPSTAGRRHSQVANFFDDSMGVRRDGSSTSPSGVTRVSRFMQDELVQLIEDNDKIRILRNWIGWD
jgi:hypothetical protein